MDLIFKFPPWHYDLLRRAIDDQLSTELDVEGYPFADQCDLRSQTLAMRSSRPLDVRIGPR